MKKILLVVHPKWCKMIFNGKKTIEVRRNRPKLEPPFEVLVYCTRARERWSVGKLGFCSDTLYTLPTGELKIGDALELMADWSGQYDEYNFLNGKVIGSFVCDDVITDFRGEHSDDFAKYALLSIDEQKKYGGNKLLYGWHITEPKLFDEPKEFYELYAPCKKNKQTADESCKGCVYAYKGTTTGKIYCDNALIRPPQSFCYVEDINEI